MYEEERRLFARAIIEATDRHLDMALRDLPVATSFRRTHVRRMRHIVRYGTLPQTRKLSKRAWALIIAAALLLTGCAVLAREEIAGFFVTVWQEKGVNMIGTSAADGAQYPTTIEVKKIPQALPEGYELVEETATERRVVLTWRTPHDDQLIYMQITRERYLANIDNEYSDFEEIELCGYHVLCIASEDGSFRYLWMDDYVYYISTTEILTRQNLENIIQSIK
ncbi:MAG: DUF4367 domain-containing protein [Clostridia bacterium]|nr:DUF4367 domain-containing protein [Clostridia bacterium]